MPLRFHRLWVAAVVLACGSGWAATPAEIGASVRDPGALYRARDWFGLQGVRGDALTPVQRAALAAALLRPDAAAQLQAVIAAGPRSAAALEAHQWLMHLFVQTGQYEKLATNFEAQAGSFPDDPEGPRDRAALAGFLALPDQEVVSSEPRTVRHDGGLFVPVTINGGSVNYFIDTGAAISSLCESEAKRLGLRLVGGGSRGTSNSQSASFRAAVADDLVIAGTRLRRVAFAVFPDEAEPWVKLPPGRRGLIGWPVQIALRRMRWSDDGTFAFGAAVPAAYRSAAPNLCMLDDHPVVQVGIAERVVPFILDCGSQTTDIYARFGEEFPALIARGQRTRAELRSVAGVEAHDAVELPDLSLRIGGKGAVLRRAAMLPQQVGPARVLGNLGFDVLRQGGGFSVDFETMHVELNAPVSAK